MTRKILCLLVLFATSFKLSAENFIGDARDNAWYVSASTGIADVEYQYRNRSDFNEQTSTYAMGVGINFLAQFSLELNYYDLALMQDDVQLGVSQGSNLIATDSLELELLMAAVVGRLPVGDAVAIVGKVGFGSWSSNETISGQNDDDSGIKIIPSVGVEFNVSQHLDVVANLLFINLEPKHFAQKTTLDVQLWSLGIKYSF